MRALLTRASAVIMLAAASVAAAPAEPTAVGVWEKLGQSGMPDAWFRIIECNGVYIGRIVRLFATRGQNPNNWRCTQCRSDQRNAPVLGITFIKGMRRQGLSYQDGSILDPRDGSIYNAQMQLSADGHELTVRGYVGIPLLGQSEVWHRLPDSAQQSSRFAACPPHAADPFAD